MAYQNPYAQAAANQNKKKKKPAVNPASMYNPQQRTKPAVQPSTMYNPQAQPQMPASQADGRAHLTVMPTQFSGRSPFTVATPGSPDPLAQAMMPDFMSNYNRYHAPMGQIVNDVDPGSMSNAPAA